jgi:hypothetical protein
MSQLNFIAIEPDRILCSFSYELQEFRWYLHPWKGKPYAGRITRAEHGRVTPITFHERTSGLDWTTVQESSVAMRRRRVRVVKRFTMDVLRRLRTRAAMRRQRYLTRSFAKKQEREERLAGEWFGEPLDLHQVPLAGKRNPRGPDGRPL